MGNESRLRNFSRLHMMNKHPSVREKATDKYNKIAKVLMK